MGESSITLTYSDNVKTIEERKVLDAARKDPAAFGDLYQLYVEPVYRYLYSRLGNVHEAEDLTAQTFLSAFEHLDQIRHNARFAPWLFAIARNKTMDHYRRNHRLGTDLPEEIPSEKADVLSQVIRSEQVAALTRLIQKLEEDERELLRLRYLAEMTYGEIAEFTNRSEQAVKKATYRLLARLHSQLEISNGKS